MLHDDGDAKRVDEFLSWLRGAIQALGDQGPVLIVTGSIGLHPLVNRLGIPDRINQDWLAARFRDHHVPLESRCPDLPTGAGDP